jgi:hypothetical protein
MMIARECAQFELAVCQTIIATPYSYHDAFSNHPGFIHDFVRQKIYDRLDSATLRRNPYVRLQFLARRTWKIPPTDLKSRWNMETHKNS